MSVHVFIEDIAKYIFQRNYELEITQSFFSLHFSISLFDKQ